MIELKGKPWELVFPGNNNIAKKGIDLMNALFGFKAHIKIFVTIFSI
ncbi:MAG: hypothetical protein IPH57_02925 [Saprospiraceae bacterium]|nr:hypothetical protein [Saprospiraceae bacterium]